MDVNALVQRLKEIVKPFTPAIGTYDKLTTGTEGFRRRQVISSEATNEIGSIMLKLIYIALGVLCAYLSLNRNRNESFITKILYATLAVFFGAFYLVYYVLRYGMNVTIGDCK
jgi:hypothetical protein